MQEKIIHLSLGRLSTFPIPLLPPIIHIAGTNGKGSTLAFMKAILERAGYKTHRYTSPHLFSLCERIEIAGVPVAEDVLRDELQSLKKIHLTDFEKLTLAAFRLFSGVFADFLLLETGLGGRLDATNIIKNPVVTGITSIGYDHQEFLGETLEEIAYEKAGIIKNRVPCCISQCVPHHVIPVIEKVAKLQDVPLIHAPFYRGDIGLKGIHQQANAGLAIQCLKQVLTLSERIIQEGIATAYWPGRLEKLSHATKDVWIDGAHNEEGAKALMKSLPSKGPWHCIVGIKKTKNYKDILDVFKTRIQIFSFLEIPEGHSPYLLKEYCGGHVANSLQEAIENAPLSSVLIAGSLSLNALLRH